MPRGLKLFLHRLQLLILQLLIGIMSGRKPILLSGPGTALQLCRTIAGLGARRVLIVTDAVLVKIGMVAPGDRRRWKRRAWAASVYDGVEPDPTHAQIEAGLALGARAPLRCGARGRRRFADGRGEGDRGLPPATTAAWRTWSAISRCAARRCRSTRCPTTAGTGSEVTVVAVVTDTVAHTKTSLVDPKLVPEMAALDAALMTGLPPAVTAATGMDALTHAVESYISGFATPRHARSRCAAVRLIFANLGKACADGSRPRGAPGDGGGLELRAASRSRAPASATCTRSRTTSAALYHTPHGLANAIVLPHVLDYSRDAAAVQLARTGGG